MTSESDTAVLHYARCDTCDTYKWCNSPESAKAAAIAHGERKNHDTYHDETEVVL